VEKLTVVSRKNASPRCVRVGNWTVHAAAVAALLVTAACGNPAAPDTSTQATAPTAANTSRVAGTAEENCTYSLSTSQQRFDRTGGEGSLTVQAPAGCSWTVAADAPWVTITGGTNMAGNGTGTITYRVAAAAEDRTATLTAAGQQVAIVQGTAGVPPAPTAAPCAISAVARPGAFSATSGSGTLEVTSACAWVATVPSWITGVTRGSGTAAVPFAVAATTVARDGTIVISPAAGFSGSPASVRVTQAAPAASPTVELTGINPSSGVTDGGTAVTITGANLPAVTGVRFGGVAAASFNAISATTVTAVTPARAAGTVDVDVVTASGTYTLRNAFTYGGCAVTVSPSSVSVGEAAVFQGPPIAITAQDGCTWSAIAEGRDPATGGNWLALVPVGVEAAPATTVKGRGTQSFALSIQANTAATARTGRVVVNGTAVVTVTQAGTIAPRLTTTFNPDPVAAIANGCPDFLPTWRYAMILTETNGGTFIVSSWAQTVTATGGSPSTTNFPGSDFVSLFGTARIGPKSSVGTKQIGLCLGNFPGGTIFYTLSGTDSSGNSVSYTTPALKLQPLPPVILTGVRP
jgi:hypothetical protein